MGYEVLSGDAPGNACTEPEKSESACLKPLSMIDGLLLSSFGVGYVGQTGGCGVINAWFQSILLLEAMYDGVKCYSGSCITMYTTLRSAIFLF
jgi:hypothetical protein